MGRSRRLLILAVALVPPVGIAFRPAPESVPVGAVAFSPDGRALATICFARSPRPHTELRLWDLVSGRERRSERRVFPDPLLTVAEGGERLVTHTWNGGPRPLSDLRLWPERLALDCRHGGAGCRSALSRDGRILATGRHWADLDQDTRVRLWDVATGRLVRTLDDGQLVDVLEFSPDGQILAGAGTAGRLGRRLRRRAGLVEGRRALCGTDGVCP